ncbi:pilus assembly PilX N-terminal domain-containing protein [Arsukibacterium indicum]|uniref:Pilus assembly PilX N-terminal domain-containing protein n=1 Tax=Arsukibacterium indicum TaxID=2848612 RepID=A0ABS6MNT3_9GAMM|nr:pilus assembly PilX N-terminal domain-containing protein [Arsukibacterium indicum]MBV2130463.1 pilus assembly PilX N-terminal domain-containing protein [Arsukibacterium indicum]
MSLKPAVCKRYQQGSALVVAVFIIVVMLAIVLALSRILLSSSDSVVYEVQGSRALFAAQSGMELALTELFPRSGASNCSSWTFNFSTAGLTGCQAQVQCTAQAIASEQLNQLYLLQSTASCNANEFITSRSIELEVRQ